MLKTSSPSDFTGKFYQVFKEEIIAILLKKKKKQLFQKIDAERIYSTQSVSPALPWPDEDSKKTLYTSIPVGHIFRSSKQKVSKSKPFTSIYLKNNIPWLSRIYPRNA